MAAMGRETDWTPCAAMEDHPAFRRGATLDQAKKAVRAARDAGLIAPTARANARKAQA